MTEEERARIALYFEALREQWKQDPSTARQRKMNGFMALSSRARLNWIKWVEREAHHDNLPWTRELVVLAATLKLGINT